MLESGPRVHGPFLRDDFKTVQVINKTRAFLFLKADQDDVP